MSCSSRRGTAKNAIAGATQFPAGGDPSDPRQKGRKESGRIGELLWGGVGTKNDSKKSSKEEARRKVKRVCGALGGRDRRGAREKSSCQLGSGENGRKRHAGLGEKGRKEVLSRREACRDKELSFALPMQKNKEVMKKRKSQNGLQKKKETLEGIYS